VPGLKDLTSIADATQEPGLRMPNSPGVMRRAALLASAVALLCSSAHAEASTSGSLTFVATRASTADFSLATGERAVTDDNPFEGPRDVHVDTRASWYVIAIRDRQGSVVFFELRSRRSKDPIVFLPPDRSLPPGRYSISVAGDAPVKVSLTVSSGHGHHTVLARKAIAGRYADEDITGVTPVAAMGQLQASVPSGALLVAASGFEADLSQAGEQDMCVARTGEPCLGGGSVSASPGAGGGSSSAAELWDRPTPGSYDASVRQAEVGVIRKAWLLVVVLG
jgi:hypothetical protein